jgi:hypothetical protein
MRITDAFDHQIRRPSLLASPVSRFSTVTNASGESFAHEDTQPAKTQADADEGKSNIFMAYIHMLDEVRVRHRKLRRFARLVIIVIDSTSLTSGYIKELYPTDSVIRQNTTCLNSTSPCSSTV